MNGLLCQVAHDNGLPLACVRSIAGRLGEREDFGALVPFLRRAPRLGAMKRIGVSGIVTSDSDQNTMAGVQPTNLGERLAWAAERPMQPKRAQRPLDMGFWDPLGDRLEML